MTEPVLQPNSNSERIAEPSAAPTAPITSASLTNAPSRELAAAQDFMTAADAAPPGLLREFLDFLIEYHLWWLTPIVLALLLLAGLVFLSTTAIAPFIYPMW